MRRRATPCYILRLAFVGKNVLTIVLAGKTSGIRGNLGGDHKLTTVNLQNDNSIARVRTGVGLAGMFVVACFGAALFFTGEQTQAAENLAEHSGAPAQIAQVVETD
jgi:hypothetical protein